MARINAEGIASVRSATAGDLAAKDQKQTQTRAAQDAWNRKVSDALDAEIKKQERLLELASSSRKSTRALRRRPIVRRPMTSGIPVIGNGPDHRHQSQRARSNPQYHRSAEAA